MSHENGVHPTSIVINVTTNIKPSSQNTDSITQEEQQSLITQEEQQSLITQEVQFIPIATSLSHLESTFSNAKL